MTKFTLVGFINMFNLIPDFVFPVFESKGIYYFQVGEHRNINNFIKIKNEIIDKVLLLENIDNYNKDVEYTVYKYADYVQGQALYAFQVSKDSIYYNQLSKFYDFMKSVQVEDDILISQINEFLSNEKLYAVNIKPFSFSKSFDTRRRVNIKIVSGSGEVKIRCVNGHIVSNRQKQYSLLLRKRVKELIDSYGFLNKVNIEIIVPRIIGRRQIALIENEVIRKLLLYYSKKTKKSFEDYTISYLTLQKEQLERYKYSVQVSENKPNYLKGKIEKPNAIKKRMIIQNADIH